MKGWLGVVWCLVAACGDNTKPQRPADAMADVAIDVPVDARLTLLPVAPSASDFMWPSLQEQFRRSDGTACTGRVALAVADQVVCYAAAGGDVRCAGAIYTHTYGSSFVAIGQTGVDEISLTPTVNSATGNSICVHKTDHTVWCMGSNTYFGAFGTGNTSPTDTFVQWGSAGLVRMTDLTDALCALDSTGQVWCAGDNYSTTPATVGTTSGHFSVYIDSFGTLHVDSTTAFRASDGYMCQVEADGLHCMAPMAQAVSGTAGAVVDGMVIQAPGGPAMGDPPVCWLETSGAVHCGVSGISAQFFTSAPPILALAGSFYSDTLCAIANDGSLWCKGTNAHGQLGTGTMTAVTTETMVQPPGSIDLTCQ